MGSECGFFSLLFWGNVSEGMERTGERRVERFIRDEGYLREGKGSERRDIL